MGDANGADLDVLGFAGSLREGSFNRGLIRTAPELAPPGMRIATFDLAPIPPYNYDVEQRGFPESVARFHDAIREADALLIATPEYQYGMSGVLKNALDWASRPPGDAPMRGKTAAILGATPGMTGTARAQAQVRQTLRHENVHAVLKPEVLVARARGKFDDEVRLVDEDARKFYRQLLENLADLTRRLATEPGSG